MKRGVSLLEVMFAILVTAIGLLGAIAIFPVAAAQQKKGRISEAVGSAGRAAVHEFDVRGMRDPRNWLWWDGSAWVVQGNSQQFIAGAWQSGYSEIGAISFCIDPRFIAANNAANAFPADTTNLGPRMRRVTLSAASAPHDPANNPTMYDPTTKAPLPMGRLMAELIFQPADDLSLVRPGIDQLPANSPLTSRTDPAIQQYDTLPTDDTIATRRQSDGHFSWLATVSPKLVQDSVTWRVSGAYALSVVMFHDRPADLPLTSERCLRADFRGMDGYTGGEVLLSALTAAELEDVRPGTWLLMGGQLAGVNVFQWYRVSDAEQEPVANAGRFEIHATLFGQDWPTDAQNPDDIATAGVVQATIVDGVVGVAEKSIRLTQ